MYFRKFDAQFRSRAFQSSPWAAKLGTCEVWKLRLRAEADVAIEVPHGSASDATQPRLLTDLRYDKL